MTNSMTGQFHVSNGQIIAPNGSVFTAKGINVTDWAVGGGGVNDIGNGTNQGQFLLQLMPGVNAVRLNAQYGSGGAVALDSGSNNYNDSPAALATFVKNLTSKGVVVEIEDHPGGNPTLSGSQLTNELQWYKDMASYYANNPYVWFGTMNEPPSTQAAVQQEQQIYDAVRSTGNTNPVMLEVNCPSSYIQGDESHFSGMRNVVWDMHVYGVFMGNGITNYPNYDSNQSDVNAALAATITQVQTGNGITSADGKIPAIIGEYGPSTAGDSSVDPNGNQVVTAVESSGIGSLAWGWGGVGSADSLQNDGILTAYGQKVASWLLTSTPPDPPPVPPSANDTVVLAGSTAAITDASGNKWTITSGGQVAVNGAADTTTANVTELAYVNGTVWQENASKLWWGKTSPSASWSPSSGTSISPLPASVTPPTTSANDTVVLAGSTAAITDAGGNKWTITAGGQVAVNGTADATTANVKELAYVNGTVWQENASKLWWDKTSPNASWSPTNGTSTSPLPASSIKVTALGTTTSVYTGTIGTKTVAGDTFVLTSANTVKVTLGATPSTLSFVGMSNVVLTGGTAAATVTANMGTNSFTAGNGALTVTGGSGADAYVYHSGAGKLTIGDFATTKGDTLSVDTSLKASMTSASDNNGGTLLTFGSLGSIDVQHVASLSASSIHWA